MKSERQKAMEWACTQKPGSVISKMILLILASHVDNEYWRCIISNSDLAEECEISISSVKEHLKNLEENNYLSVTARWSYVALPNEYQLIRNREVK